MRLRATFAAVVVVPAMLLAACGSGEAGSGGAGSDGTGSGAASSPSTPGSSGAGSAGTASSAGDGSSSGAEPDGPDIPADTEVADPVPRDEMPTATGDFGDKPTITAPDTSPPDSLQRVVLAEGDGPTSEAGDTVVVNYLGQVWGGDVFDNSYDRDTPFTLQVGVDTPRVVAGWNVGLTGVKQGSRVMLSFPPRDGYGKDGSAPAIGGDDTLIFVVDVVKVYPPDVTGDADATPQEVPSGWPEVDGDPGEIPSVSVPSSLLPPQEPGVTVLDKADGPPAQAGSVLVQYVATSWDGSRVEQSWPDSSGENPNSGAGPQAFSLGDDSAFADLIGVPIGSRVMLRTPANDQQGAPPLAWVMDLIAQQAVAQSAGDDAQ